MYSVPPELARLSLAEKLLIQKISPFVPLQHIRQGVMGLKGHVCAFEQDISGVCRDLPKLPSDISIIRIIKEISVEIGNSKEKAVRVYRVNKNNVLSALRWLQKHSTEYRDINIMEENLDWIEGDEGILEPRVDISDINDNDNSDDNDNDYIDDDNRF